MPYEEVETLLTNNLHITKKRLPDQNNRSLSAEAIVTVFR